MTFVYGSDETLYACAPSFEKVMNKYGVDYEMIVGKGMFHCYPEFPIVKEAQEGWDKMVDLISRKSYYCSCTGRDYDGRIMREGSR